MPADHERGLIDTNIMILRRWINPEQLPVVPVARPETSEPR